MLVALSIIIALCLVGALVARFCGQQSLWHLQRRPINWDAVLPWICGACVGILIPILIALILILALRVGTLGLLAIVAGLILGLLAPELWTGFSAWIRDPRHLAQAVTGLVLVAGVTIILLNLDLVFALVGPLLVLVVVLGGLALMLRPLLR